MISSLIRKLKYNFCSEEAGNQLLEWDRISRTNRRFARKKGFTVAQREDLVKFKKSDSILILGSGTSINDLTNEDWLHAQQMDSIGFNWFFVHSFIPTFYHMELRESEFEFFKSCYHQLNKNYSKVPFMVNINHISHNWDFKTLSFIKNLSITTPERYSEISEAAFREVLQHYYHTDNYLKKDLLIHPRASIITLISFGVLLGYKKIILAGIDLINTDYFFYSDIYDSQLAKMVANFKEKNELRPASGIHSTADKKIYPTTLTIDLIIKIFKEEVLDFLGIELFVSSKKSLLYPDIPALDSL